MEQITTSEGVDIILAREELTVLRRNVALRYEKKRRVAVDGEIVPDVQRRPPWAGFQQRLVSQGDIDFVEANPLDSAEIARVTARCAKNLEKAGFENLFGEFCEFAKERDYDFPAVMRHLELCEKISHEVSKRLVADENELILAYCDLHVLSAELMRLEYLHYERSWGLQETST